MRVITLNMNGLRSAASKGFFDWLSGQNADVVCLQEIKAQGAVLDDPAFRPAGWHVEYLPAQTRKGYSGVGILSRRAPAGVRRGLGWDDVDAEGRWLVFDYPEVSVVSCYLPSGSSSEQRQTFKYDVLARLEGRLAELAAEPRPYILCGDFNIAHRQIDLKNWRSNQKNSGFLPDERAWMDRLLAGDRWLDAFRQLDDRAEQYTWWSNRGQAWAKNVGWRIDYQIVSAAWRERLLAASIHREPRFSDHAPLTVDYRV